MRKRYDFNEQLEYSRGVRKTTDLDVLLTLLVGCVTIEKSTPEQDREGVDYIATLRNGATVLIDAKTRTPGCSRFWKDGPELALEIWSVRPAAGLPGKTGWTLCEAKNVDYILFTFPPEDSNSVFLYPFQLLRIVFRKNCLGWKATFKGDIQDSGGWQSECVFVPEPVVWEAVRDVMCIESP